MRTDLLKFFNKLAILPILCLALIGLSTTSNAQINNALTAKATQSDNRATPYDAGNYNDGTIAAAGSTPWGWLSCSNTSGYSAWIMYEWTKATSVNQLHFYNVLTTRRCMVGAEIQYWDGSAWKTAGTLSTTAQIEVIFDFPTVTTTKLRITKFTMAGTQLSNPNWREIKANFISYGPNDAGVASVDSPSVFCGGTQSIYATIQNFGINQIDTLTVNWELDGVAQKAIKYYGVLDTAGGKGSTSAQIKLASVLFNTQRSIKVWTSDPNNIKDTVPDNDTAFTVRKPSLAGRVTVGPKGDYTKLTDLVDDLSDFGVCGPMEVIVRPGVYTGSLEFGEIAGASATNTISFKSASPDSVTITNAGTSTANWATIMLDGADYVSFENFTIKTTGSSFGAAIFLTNEADYNVFKGNEIEANLTATSGNVNAIILSGSKSSYSAYGNSGNYNVFQDNNVEGGYFGVRMQGTNSTSFITGNKFFNNTFTKQYYYSVYGYYCNESVWHDNVMKDQRNTYNYGMMFYYHANYDIQRNYVKCAYYNALYYGNRYLYNSKIESIYANNTLISTGTSYTLYGYYMGYTKFVHNSLYGKGSYMMYWYYMNNNDIRNNIFYYEGTNACIYTYNPTWEHWDYNDYYLTGGNVALINGATYANISALKGYNSTANQNNWDLDPGWVTKDDDAHLSATFPDMFGPYAGMDIDIDGDARCTLVSTIGSDEKPQSLLPPAANFLKPDTLWLNSTSIILNAAKAKSTEGAKWYVNGVLMSDSLHLEYTPTKAGTDSIKLVMFNCGGTDSITKGVLVSPILRKPKADFSSTSSNIYTNETINLLDLTDNGATQWTWSITPAWTFSSFLQIRDRTHTYHNVKDSTTAYPKVTFHYPGVYAVKLKVANVNGSDSIVKTKFIIVRESAKMCDLVNDSEADFGTLYDDGGVNGGYSPGLTGINSCVYRVSTCKGELVMSMTDFDLGAKDYLQLYDGRDDTGKPLWNAAMYPDGMTGSLSDPSVNTTLTATTGSVYAVFTSDADAQTTGDGFALDWDVNPVTWTNPTADFSFPDTACVGFATYFENTTTGVYSDLEWDVNGDQSVEGYEETLGYTFMTTGTYDVRLRANTYCAGTDSVTKKIVIINAAKAPTAEFTTSATKVYTLDTVKLSDITSYCSNYTAWKITPANYQLLDGEELSDGELEFVFTRGGFYTIELVKGNTFGKDSVEKINLIEVLEYCTPSVASINSDLGISRVAFHTIDNKSAIGVSDFGNYRKMVAEVERGWSYEITIERNTALSAMSRKVWIDWNIDGDFDDAGEMVSYEPSASTLSYSDSIKIPATATPGRTIMRIGTNYKTMSNIACGPHQFGEFEDYGIEVSAFDKTAPKLVLFGQLEDTMEVNTQYMDAGFRAYDLLDGNMTGSVNRGKTLDTSKVGVYTIIYTVIDAAGNSAKKERIIHVLDTKAPTIALNGADTIYMQVLTGYGELGVTTTDNYDVNPSHTALGNLDTATVGTYEIDYCVTDSEGNGPVCVKRWVIVGDSIKPVITLVGADAIDVAQCGEYTDEGYVVVENDDYSVATSGSFENETSETGTFTVTYTVTDDFGHTADVTRTINIVDEIAPTIELVGDLVQTLKRWGAPYSEEGFDLDDYCNGADDVTVEEGGTYDEVSSMLTTGIFTKTYQATDAAGNKSPVITRMLIIETPLSMNQINVEDGISLFPNPTNGIVYLSTENTEEQEADIVVYDLSGKEVMRRSNTSMVSGTVLSLDLSGLSAGTYHVQIQGEAIYSIKKLILSK